MNIQNNFILLKFFSGLSISLQLSLIIVSIHGLFMISACLSFPKRNWSYIVYTLPGWLISPAMHIYDSPSLLTT